jgi:FMN phosphatase YigB (HAD superfamily)
MKEATELICFDLGGVLVETARRWEAACAAAGVAPPAERSSPFPWDRLAPIVDAYERDLLSWSEYLRECATVLDGRHTETELSRIHEGWLLGEFAGVFEIVQRLNATPGVRSCCLSNTNRRHWEIMTSAPERFAAFHALERRWNSFELRERKPDAAIYRAMEQASGVAASRILFFDDREENVEAARACGWRAEPIDRDAPVAGQILAHLRAHRVPGF